MLAAIPYRLGHLARVTPTAPPNPLYVNTVTGTAGGTGTEADPVNSLALAQALCAGYPDWTIKVHAPVEAPLRQQITYESTMELAIEGLDNEPWYLLGSERFTSGWSGTGPIYSRTLGWTSVAAVTVTTMIETILGTALEAKLVPNTATPTSPAQGQYGYTGGVLNVRLPGDANPNNHTIEVGRRNAALITQGFGRLTVRDAVARYCLVAGAIVGLSTQPEGTGKLTIEDSDLSYNGGNGLGVAGVNLDTVATNCTALRNTNDGFNLHNPNGVASTLTLNGCRGSYNGDTAGQSAQGASNHGSTVMVINGGRYDGNVSGGMVVIDDARCDIHGDTVYGPVVMDGNMRLGNTAGTIAGQAGCAWLNNSTGTVTGPVSVTNGGGTGVRVAATATVIGADAIVSTGNALPDSLA